MRNGKSPVKGFTMTELIVVIGILALIMGLTLVTVVHIKKTAYNSNTKASIQALTGAIDVYYQNFRAYPGPADDAMKVTGGVQLTSMSENLFLGLSGGLTKSSNGAALNPSYFSRGPMDLASGKQYTPFLRAGVPHSDMLPSGSGLASFAPVYVDANAEPMPILYYRAKKGEVGEMQYGVVQNAYWTNNASLGPADKKYGHHGLTANGSFGSSNNPIFAQPMANDLLPFLHNPMELLSPRGKDKYVLIAAGMDRTYGTTDDLTSFGPVVP